MIASVARRVVEPFVPVELRRDHESLRVARLLISAAVAAAPITFGLAAARWAVEGSRSRIGALIATAALLFALVPPMVRVSGSSRLGATMILVVGAGAVTTMAVLEGGLRSEALLWMAMIPIAAALLKGERAVLPWAIVTLAAVAAIAARDLLVGPSQRPQTMLHAAAAAGAVAFGAVLGRSYEAGRAASAQAMRALAAAERERALADQRAELLVVSLKQRDEFLSVASHELRTPVTAMKLWVQRGERMSDGPHATGRLREANARIAAQVGRLERLIDELLDVSRLLEHRLELSPERVMLDEIAREVATSFEPEAARVGCALELDVEAVEGRWDKSRLDQIVTNLVSNALKYASGKPVLVRVRGGGGEASLSVRDRGPGIPIADQARIFDRFERLHGAKGPSGLGLGLWITRRLVESMGGRIELESSEGEGSTFTVWLPTGGE